MKTCLIVDPAPVVRKVASRVLLGPDMAVEGFADAADADAWLTANGSPDILLIGVGSKDTAGPAFIADLRKRRDGAHCTVLAAIVESNLGLMTRLRRAGADGYVFKPFDRERLRAAIDPHLLEAAHA